MLHNLMEGKKANYYTPPSPLIWFTKKDDVFRPEKVCFQDQKMLSALINQSLQWRQAFAGIDFFFQLDVWGQSQGP